jgi:hypothetical protein
MNRSKERGAAAVREVQQLHRRAGIDCEAIPQWGRPGTAYDGDLIIRGDMRASVRARASGEGFRLVEDWLGRSDALFLKRDGVIPLVVLPFEQYRNLLARRQGQG